MVRLSDQLSVNVLPIGIGENTMIFKQHKLLYLLIVINLIILLTGCTSNPTDSQFIVRVSGSTNGLQFDGQCTAQNEGFLSGESVAVGLDVKGTIDSVNQPKDYETYGYFIYCAIANQSGIGTITVELLQEGNVVASAQSTSPDKPATFEFGQTP